MTSMTPSLVERMWASAHAGAWFPGWTLFQIAAVVLGGLLVLREGGHRLVAPYVLGVVLAVAAAVTLGSGGAWLAWATGPRSAPLPELEIAGFGALFGLIAGHLLGARGRRVSTARALDVLAPSIGIMIAVARAGCFFAGCDFGRPSSVPWALRYPTMTPAFRAQVDAGLVGAGASHTLPVHPTQLYEAAIGVVILVVTLRMRSAKRAGDRFLLAAVLYAVGRILVDVLRGDLARGGMLGLTVTQALAVALLGLVIAWRSASAAQGPLRLPGRASARGATAPATARVRQAPTPRGPHR
jgi:hypothetical protein